MAGSRTAAPALGCVGNDRPTVGRRRGLPCRQRFHHAADAVCIGFERDGIDRHAPSATAVRFRRHQRAAVLDDFSRRRAHSLFPYRQNAAPDTPTLVYAYGGFGIPELPHYLGSVGKYWLEEGNAFVLANIRGGGEFGPRWHQAAQGVSKHKSVDDYWQSCAICPNAA